MNEVAIMEIKKALENCMDYPKLNWPKQEKFNVTFTRWALEEMLLLVWDHPWTPASETIEIFAMKLEVYAEMAVSEEQNLIFTIAADTAWSMFKMVQRLDF